MYIVYLSATEDNQINKPILSVIKKHKHTTINRAFSEQTENKPNHVAQTTKEIKKADGIVVECSTTNFDLGRLLTLSLLQHKPVLLLQMKGKEQDLELGESRLVTKKTYKQDNEDEIEKSLEKFVKIIEKQRLSYRFNLMLSRDINTYLMDQSQVKSISKADYIRTLILQDME
ncbi:hypothetical protein CO051_02665 [Candidatus Roizmanbacteria bacterium CG_4_9_14_0_2_um_filter_39_13]|uniref:Nucleoside 2-deoxyribosyltransferase n=2 Tax=Candidatus Roizmaniibacteriota TaxID=1752723 RepID=A0A2M8F0C1_9BACT|nr:MAG: hypothetical protein CO051_02665 [Candidatus Roizmanbacteria bacterium CG_4_9_14_0_2_um_filter_39_13]PJE62219.1 MAG: hypothetical protein COU87_00545 [Candidatus Roizmanbacteria bacterium CG10_big_fil_rev_8_21_14_0_10_39_12]